MDTISRRVLKILEGIDGRVFHHISMMTLITVKMIQTQIIYRFAFDLKFANKNIPII